MVAAAFVARTDSDGPHRDVLTRLRTETRDLHDAIEANPKFLRLMAPDLTQEEYGRMLARLLPFHRRVEADLAQALAPWGAPLELDRRAKAPLLEADLAALGLPAPVGGCDVALAEDAPSAWGTLYVLEGSTLGGRVILKRLQATLGVDVGRGASFYAGYGALTGPRWQAFRATLSAAVLVEPSWEDAIVAAGRRAFAALDAWMAGA